MINLNLGGAIPSKYVRVEVVVSTSVTAFALFPGLIRIRRIYDHQWSDDQRN